MRAVYLELPIEVKGESHTCAATSSYAEVAAYTRTGEKETPVLKIGAGPRGPVDMP